MRAEFEPYRTSSWFRWRQIIAGGQNADHETVPRFSSFPVADWVPPFPSLPAQLSAFVAFSTLPFKPVSLGYPLEVI